MPSETVPGQSLAFGGDANFAQEQDPVGVAHVHSCCSCDDVTKYEKIICFVFQNQLNPNANIFMYGSGAREGGEFGQAESEGRGGGRSERKDNAQFGSVDKDGFQMQSTRMCSTTAHYSLLPCYCRAMCNHSIVPRSSDLLLLRQATGTSEAVVVEA